MSLEQFFESPWKNSHSAYSRSPFAMVPAPEFATSEIMISSLYRHIGLGVSERDVPKNGRNLGKHITSSRNNGERPEGALLDADGFSALLYSILESPKRPAESKKRFVQTSPLVPAVGMFSGSARNSGNSWPAGAMVRRLITLGADTPQDACTIWQELHTALAVDPEDDDVFAKFLELEIGAWLGGVEWSLHELSTETLLSEADRDGLDYPARQFNADLREIIGLKPILTRKQWISLLDAIVRLASISHVMWVCELQSQIWQCLRNSFKGDVAQEVSELRARIFPENFRFIAYGDHFLSVIDDKAAEYLQARLGINAIMNALEEAGAELPGLSSSSDILVLCKLAHEHFGQDSDLLQRISELSERETRALRCKSGIGKNIVEFARHVLGQRPAAEAVLQRYDQSFAVKKSGSANSSPWVVSLGPVAVLAVVHCALAGTTGLRSVRRLAKQLDHYGIFVDYREIAANDLGHQLRILGLVLDSPDAESGMLLVPPFSDGEARVS